MSNDDGFQTDSERGKVLTKEEVVRSVRAVIEALVKKTCGDDPAKAVKLAQQIRENPELLRRLVTGQSAEEEGIHNAQGETKEPVQESQDGFTTSDPRRSRASRFCK
jgi:hypothetical protein